MLKVRTRRAEASGSVGLAGSEPGESEDRVLEGGVCEEVRQAVSTPVRIAERLPSTKQLYSLK